jgi:predicted DNA-binding WGR domain protein
MPADPRGGLTPTDQLAQPSPTDQLAGALLRLVRDPAHYAHLAATDPQLLADIATALLGADRLDREGWIASALEAAHNDGAPSGSVHIQAWFYERVRPGLDDKFYHLYLAELPGGEALVARHWGRRRTRGQQPTIEHYTTMAGARRRVEEVRAQREARGYTLLGAGRVDPDAGVLDLLGLTGVAAAAATNPFDRHTILAQRLLRLLTGDAGSEHLQVMRALRDLVDVLDGAMAEVRSRQELLERRFRQVVMADGDDDGTPGPSGKE